MTSTTCLARRPYRSSLLTNVFVVGRCCGYLLPITNLVDNLASLAQPQVGREYVYLRPTATGLDQVIVPHH